MRFGLRIFLAVLLFSGWAQARVPLGKSLPDPPKPGLEVGVDRHRQTLWVENKEYAPYTLEFTFPLLQNVSVDCKVPCRFVVPPRQRLRLLRYTQISKKQAWHWNYHYQSRIGDYRRQSKKHLYQIPFASGFEVLIAQGYQGRFSHNGNHAYALDFMAPQGTPVYAARGGTVVWTVDLFSQGGHEERFKNHANQVLILHSDGSLGLYAHFMHKGVAVRKGQKLKAGDLVGYVGKTGYASRPHLHFEVVQTGPDLKLHSFSTLFQTSSGPQILKQGQKVRRP